MDNTDYKMLMSVLSETYTSDLNSILDKLYRAKLQRSNRPYRKKTAAEKAAEEAIDDIFKDYVKTIEVDTESGDVIYTMITGLKFYF